MPTVSPEENNEMQDDFLTMANKDKGQLKMVDKGQGTTQNDSLVCEILGGV